MTGGWVRDGAIAGALGGPATLLGMFGMLVAIREPLGDGIFLALVAAAIGGGLIGGAAGWPAGALTRAAFRLHPAIGLTLGPLVGGLGALVTFEAMTVALESHLLVGRELLWVTGAGAVALGPPWVGYVAVRARGRSGLGVALALPVWTAAVGAAVILLALRLLR